MSKSREQLESWLSTIHLKNSLVLDIGAQNKPVKDRIGKHENTNFKTLDIDPQWNPDFTVDIGDKDVWQDLIDVNIGKYDAIFALELFEHVSEIENALENISLVLKPSGTFYYSMPFINPLHDYYDHARYTPEGFTELLQKAGFTEIDIKYRRATAGRDDLLSFYKKEGMRISKIRNDHHLIDLVGIMGSAKVK